MSQTKQFQTHTAFLGYHHHEHGAHDDLKELNQRERCCTYQKEGIVSSAASVRFLLFGADLLDLANRKEGRHGVQDLSAGK